ncbi:probable beta-hexosaminidase fdl isoform X3 [Aethina tumida]|uniref:probable beta-hexosaminidase fdl isoform X3 n=1 Tax=Aethina tumida TaxID=116153 RepID=UPI002147B67E|nr:probable beta-hexosaminidase fdl isoform X3 [Aethina tumida]
MYEVKVENKYERRERMKQGELRRALLVVTLLCIFLFVYLYWQQSTDESPHLVYKYKHAYPSNRAASQPPQWTWECINQRCERQHIKPDATVASVSLSTCSMLCGSTQLWPQPTGPMTLSSKAITFNHKLLEFESKSSGATDNLLQRAFAIFNDSIYALVQNKDYINQKTEISKFRVTVLIVDTTVTKLKLTTDESYTIALKPHGNDLRADITAKTFFGARHGLETLSQLVWWDEYHGEGILKVLKGATIQDKPAFAYRGLMVDTARNFLSLESLKRTIVGMASNKLNVFHWHVSDSQSFPLIMPRVPELAKYGAYSPEMVYTPDEVKGLVDFALVRGVRVVIEVDAPAHAGNGWTWGSEQGLGELAVCVNERPWSLYCGEPPCGQLNPDNPNVYDVLEKIYKDLIELTGETEIFHLGGDEVNLECWAQHMQKTSSFYNYTDLHDLWGDFTLKALAKLESANGGKKIPHVVLWSSNLSKRPYLTKYLNKDNVVIQSWGASQWPDTTDLNSDGYRVIISHVDAWYLDCGFGRWRETGEAACDPYRPWQTVYNHKPWQQLHLNKNQVMGGEVCLWSEQLEEGSLDARLWPRAAAFAERVWSDPHLDVSTFIILEDVYTRLNTHRDRLVNKGLQAEALWPAWCKQNPGMCL